MKELVLQGLTLSHISRGEDEIVFTTNEGVSYRMFHSQQCCERVSIEDIEGDLDDLIGMPLLVAEERTRRAESRDGSETWTFYTLATFKGYVSIRWYGSSNGWYSEAVQIEEL